MKLNQQSNQQTRKHVVSNATRKNNNQVRVRYNKLFEEQTSETGEHVTTLCDVHTPFPVTTCHLSFLISVAVIFAKFACSKILPQNTYCYFDETKKEKFQ